MELTDMAGLAGIPLIVAMVEIAKRWIVDDRWWAPMAILLGIVWNVGLAAIQHTDMAPAAIVGIVVGLASSGLYSGGRTVARI